MEAIDDSTWLAVKNAGLGQEFRFSPLIHRCGDITDGVAFEIGKGGGWVIPIEELRAMLAEAESHRR